MSEFNNRIDVQRDILNIVNGKRWTEELYGLSSGAIDRWIQVNNLDPSSHLVLTIYESAEKLFFLANKSQEQITDEYRFRLDEMEKLTKRLRILSTT